MTTKPQHREAPRCAKPAQKPLTTVPQHFKPLPPTVARDAAFFDHTRTPRPNPQKPIAHDVPAAVVHNAYEQTRQSQASRYQDIMTLPPIGGHRAAQPSAMSGMGDMSGRHSSVHPSGLRSARTPRVAAPFETPRAGNASTMILGVGSHAASHANTAHQSATSTMKGSGVQSLKGHPPPLSLPQLTFSANEGMPRDVKGAAPSAAPSTRGHHSSADTERLAQVKRAAAARRRRDIAAVAAAVPMTEEQYDAAHEYDEHSKHTDAMGNDSIAGEINRFEARSMAERLRRRQAQEQKKNRKKATKASSPRAVERMESVTSLEASPTGTRVYAGASANFSDMDIDDDEDDDDELAGIRLAGVTGDEDHRAITTVDEEASSRVLKVMFQLNLTKNSAIIAKLKNIDPMDLQRRVVVELGHKKQMSRDEFYMLLCKTLKDDYLNKRDAMTLFSVFDDDKSGLVDGAEFVSGFMTLVTAGEHDIAFKFIHTILEARGEKSIVNAFISRFEVQLLIHAAQHHFADDKEIVDLLAEIPEQFNFSHHLGRIPIVELRDALTRNDDYHAIFTALPNPAQRSMEGRSPTGNAPSSPTARHHQGDGPGDSPDKKGPDVMLTTSASREDFLQQQQLQTADQFINTNHDMQREAKEHDSPRWWVSGGIIYKASEHSPFPQPVFIKDSDKRGKA
jgi:hypothetical protein